MNSTADWLAVLMDNYKVHRPLYVVRVSVRGGGGKGGKLPPPPLDFNFIVPHSLVVDAAPPCISNTLVCPPLIKCLDETLVVLTYRAISYGQVLLYNGQLDISVGPPLTERYLQVLYI